MTQPLAGGWTLERLRARTPEERHTIWRNAMAAATPQALALARFIETAGLAFAPTGGIGMSDPRVLEMRAVIESPEGRRTCVAAVQDGLPALAGVEPMIVARMGERYGAFSQMTLTAGAIVAEVMTALGYRKVQPRRMPAGSVARTAAFWETTEG